MRAFLGGRGLPRGEFALSGISESTDAPIILRLEDGEVFTPADYIALGYTNFEVWCVGAAGGLGGGELKLIEFDRVASTQAMDSALWAKFVDLSPRRYEYLNGIYNPTAGLPAEWSSWDEYLSYTNPTHSFQVYTYSNARMRNDPAAIGARGGGSGGGGVHVIAGVLADLDATLDISVGAAGDDAEPGQTKVNGAWTPMPWDRYYVPEYQEAMLYPVGSTIRNYLLDIANFLHQYPGTQKAFYPPVTGDDGATSSFGDICRASGGKGGHGAKIWSGSTFVVDGDGGDGGIGDSDISGGGGAGSPNPGVRGSDGAWNTLTSVGKGGGGGHGGSVESGGASGGGKGSFSYVDTSIYGLSQSSSALVAGNGGGVRALRNYRQGSRVPTYDPNGAVFLRLYKLD